MRSALRKRALSLPFRVHVNAVSLPGRRRAGGHPAAARGHDRDQVRSARARAAADGVARGARHRRAGLQRPGAFMSTAIERRVFRAGKLMAPEPKDAVRDSVNGMLDDADLRLRAVRLYPAGEDGVQVPQRPRARIALAPVDGRGIMWGAATVRVFDDIGGRGRGRTPRVPSI